MSAEYQGLSGEVYNVEENKIAGGGEGSIHVIQNYPDMVAKIFKTERRTAEREKKLSLMVKTKLNEEQLKQITWPQDVIFDNTGFAGYVMPKLGKAVSLNEIYSNGTEQYDLQYRLLAAVNLCAAVQTVHEMGQVCGDLNPQNICINLDLNDRKNVCKVTLVDTDSYHFIAEGQTYRCEVGLADYIAPEVQKKMSGGMNLRNAPLPTYTKETDLFAVAVHVFTLLMNGCHPFACARDVNGKWENTMKQASSSTMDSVVAPQPIENIKDGYFPFYEHRPGITYPLYAPAFDSLPESLRRLFIQTFVDGYQNPTKRVGTEEWIQTLLGLRDSIVECGKNKQHYYFGYNAECPLCAVEKRIEGAFYYSNKENEKRPKDTFSNSSSTRGTSTSTFNINKRNLDVEKKEKRALGVCVALMVACVCLFLVIGKLSSNKNGGDSLDYYQEEQVNYENTATPEDSISEEEQRRQEEEKKRQEAQRKKEEKKRKEDAKKLKAMNKIIAAIKAKKYKKAGNLVLKYVKKHNVKKIYVHNSKIVKTIKNGKGFVLRNNATAYYGQFKKGKKNGKGIEVGCDWWDDNFVIHGVFKNNKLNGKCTIYQWNQALGGEKYNLKTEGVYKDNKENGKMSLTYEYRSGGVDHKYYCYSSKGKRKVLDYDSDVGYVYAKTANGDYYVGNSKKKYLSGHGHPQCFSY